MRKIYKNILFLTLSHCVGYVIPLLEIPILARALGPMQYGQIVFLQSIALLSSLVVEYGFNLSASRQVAANSGDKIALAKILSDVMVAKAFLAVLVLFTLLVAFFVFKGLSFPANPDLLPWAFLYFLAFGFSPFWFFQGLERMAEVVVLELGLRLSGLLLLFIFVSGENDAHVAMAILSLTSFLNTTITIAICIRHSAPIRIDMKSAIRQVKQGFHVFIYRSFNNVLLNAAPSVLGLSGGAAAVAGFVPAEKVVRGIVGFSAPVLTGLFPYFSRLFSNSKDLDIKALTIRKAYCLVGALSIVGVMAALLLTVFGPAIVSLVLGDGFLMVQNILRLLVWLIPLRITNQALGMVLFIPARKDRVASGLLLVFSCTAMVVGALLSIRIGVEGMVYGLLGGELGLLVALLVASRSIGLNRA